MAREAIYWDSNAFLALLNQEAGKTEKCEDVWVGAENGLFLIATSTLTVAEVIYMKGVPKLDPAKRPKVNSFFRASHIVQKPLTRTIAELARDVVWDLGIKPKDAIHIATAVYYKIQKFHTFDDLLLNQKSVALSGFTVSIQKPHAQRQMGFPNV